MSKFYRGITWGLLFSVSKMQRETESPYINGVFTHANSIFKTSFHRTEHL